MRILLGMSGGVDSTYAASLLLSSGHSVEGAVIVMHEYTELAAAEEAASSLGIPLHVIDARELFADQVKADLVSEYAAARTPNPCIICNERVKLRVLYDYAMEHGFDKIATGHYASVGPYGEEGRMALKLAEDTKKDQTYMLYRLPREILSSIVFPLAEGDKEGVRRAAREKNLSSADKKDSQEICFLPNGDHAGYIESVLGKLPGGNFVDENGNILGTHKGIIHYTVGQRKGLGISLGERAFVTDIDPVTRNITLSPSHRGVKTVELSNVVFSGAARPESARELTADIKLRYTAPLVSARVMLYPEGRAVLRFENEVKAAPGQSAVIYRDGVVLAGGFIERGSRG